MKLLWPIPVGLALGLAIAAAPSAWTRFRAARRLAQGLRDETPAAEILPEQLEAYDRRMGPYTPDDVLDEKVWDDLHLSDVFARIDRCVSQPGRQLLYHMLRRPPFDGSSVGALHADVEALRADTAAMARLQYALRPLGTRSAARLEAALFGALPPRPGHWWIFPVMSVLGFLLLGAVFFQPQALIAWIGLCVVTVLSQLVYKQRLAEFVPAMSALRDFVDVAGAVGAIPLPALSTERATLRDGAARWRSIRTSTAWLRFDSASANELAGSLYEWCNMLFALDLSAFMLASERLRDERATGQAMFRALGLIDATRSIAVWRSELAQWTLPEFTPPTKVLGCEGLVHPLLSAPVPNALELDGMSLLVTGSNMSGKTTFLRAIGVNAVLAQSVGTVCATAWQSPVLHVRTSISQGDSLIDGKSFYMAEVESVKRMLDAKGQGRTFLFLLDELFRGTNTPERVAAAHATLAWLDRGDDIVCVATHDIELHALLGERFTTCHFREQVTDESLTFDFVMRPGLASTRNAIALLRLTGYPAELVARADASLSRSSAPHVAKES